MDFSFVGSGCAQHQDREGPLPDDTISGLPWHATRISSEQGFGSTLGVGPSDTARYLRWVGIER